MSNDNVAVLTGKHFSRSSLLALPFRYGLTLAFSAAAAMSLLATLVSLLRGGHYVDVTNPARTTIAH